MHITKSKGPTIGPWRTPSFILNQFRNKFNPFDYLFVFLFYICKTRAVIAQSV
jgi:hypothetical protein